MAEENFYDILLDTLTVDAAKSSTKEYYYKWKDSSYSLDLSSSLRGRALVFVSTVNREGWQKDVTYFYTCCKSLNITAEIVYDPDVHKVDHALQEFVTSDDNCGMIAVLLCLWDMGLEKNTMFTLKQRRDSLISMQNVNFTSERKCQR